MTASRVGVTAGLCDLIAGMTSGPGCATLGPNIAIELEKLYVYSLIWSVGGLLEFDDRSVLTDASEVSIQVDLYTVAVSSGLSFIEGRPARPPAFSYSSRTYANTTLLTLFA